MNRTNLRKIILEEIGKIAPEADLANIEDAADLREAIDLDSMDIFNLVVALSRRLGFEIPEADAGRLVTLNGSIDYLERASEKPDAE